MVVLSADRFRADIVALLDRFTAVTGKADSSICRACFGAGADTSYITKLRTSPKFSFNKAADFEVWLRKALDLAERDPAAFDQWFRLRYDRAVRPRRAAARTSSAVRERA